MLYPHNHHFVVVVVVVVENGGGGDSETGALRTAFADQLSSLGSDSTGSHSTGTGGDSSVYKG